MFPKLADNLEPDDPIIGDFVKHEGPVASAEWDLSLFFVWAAMSDALLLGVCRFVRNLATERTMPSDSWSCLCCCCNCERGAWLVLGYLIAACRAHPKLTC